MPQDARNPSPDLNSDDGSQLVDEIVDLLRDRILRGELAPGTPLRQVELAEHLGVSRTPLREALRVLSNMGLITTGRYKRTLEVVQLSSEDVIELLEVREAIDPIVAAAAARNGLPLDIVLRLRELIEAMEQSDDQPFGHHEHVEFHSLLHEHCGSRVLETMAPLLRLSGASIRLSVNHPGSNGALAPPKASRAERKRILAHHRALLDAILSRDPERAKQVAQEHNHISREPLLRTLGKPTPPAATAPRH